MKKSSLSWMAFVVALWFVLGACAPTLPPPAASGPPSLVSGQPLQVASSDPARDLLGANCMQVVAPDIRRRLDLPAPEATEPHILSLGQRVPEWAACAREGWIDRGLYREALLTLRGLLMAWYEQAPRLRAHALALDPSAEDRGRSVAPAPDLADLCVLVETELERDDQAEEHPVVVLQEDLGRGRVMAAMMSTDALFGVISGQLGAAPRPAGPLVDELTRTVSLADAIAHLGRSMARESRIWADDFFGPDPRTAVEARTERTRGAGITLGTRLGFVSSQVRKLAGFWVASNEELRRDLGLPYDAYVAPLTETAERAGKRALAWEWLAPLHDVSGVEPSRAVLSEVSLSRIQEEIAFDRYNLRALFAWQTADRRVRELFAFEGLESGDRLAIELLSRALLEAGARTDDPSAKLEALSLLVMTSDIEDGQATSPGTIGPVVAPAVPAAAQLSLLARRRRASRHFAETALCELNRSWLGGPPCGVTIAGGSAIPPGDPCRLPATAPATSPPLPSWMPQAYGRLLATLAPVVTWTAGSPPDPVVSARTHCEIARLTNGLVRGRVPLELGAYEHLTRILVERSIVVPAADAGTMLANAIDLAETDALSACQRLPLCTPASVAAEAERRRKANLAPVAQANANRFEAHYCEVIHHGARIAELALQARSPARTGQSLGAIGRPYLRPPSLAAFKARGDDLIAKSAACSRLAAGRAAPTPGATTSPSSSGR